MADEIYCTIVEDNPIEIIIAEDNLINVNVQGGMGSFDNIQDILKDYLIIEDLSSDIEPAKVTFNSSFEFFTESLVVWINGLKERPIAITENSFTLSMDLDTDDVLECQYLKQ